MPFAPVITQFVGIEPILQAAQTIIETDFTAALAWRCALVGATPGADYARVQTSQMHSKNYPLLVIQPATDDPSWLGTGGEQQDHGFDVEIFLTKAVSAGNPIEQVDALAFELLRYYEATRWAFQAATPEQWLQHAPVSADVGHVRVTCTQAVFGQLQQSVEAKSEYLRSVAFELRVRLIEAE